MRSRRLFFRIIVPIVLLVVVLPIARLESAKQPNLAKYGVFYQIFVRSWADGDGDGVGDLRGIINNLEYLADLGVSGIWLTPIHPSPTYHKYDVVDYLAIDPEIGTMEDFEELVFKAKQLGIGIILDLVTNHTSSKHPWFVSATEDPASLCRDYYIFADSKTRVDAIGPWGQRVWHREGDVYYYGLFWEEMPDLNYANLDVRQEIKAVAQFWLKKGVAGFRLDAAKHIFEHDRSRSPHEWWSEFSAFVRNIQPDVYLIAEVWDSTFVVGPYFEHFDSNFNFDLATALLQVVSVGIDNGLVKTLEGQHEAFASYNPNFIDAPFLSNHDQNRSMSRFNDIDKAKLAASIYLTLPGNPFIYYGEEIGMKGVGDHENIREPFKWFPINGEGQTSWQQITYNIGDWQPSVKEQALQEDSLLNHYRRLINLRKSHEALMYGKIKGMDLANKRILAYQRKHHEDEVIVFHNLSGVVQNVTLESSIWTRSKVLFSCGNYELEVNEETLRLTLGSRATLILQ